MTVSLICLATLIAGAVRARAPGRPPDDSDAERDAVAA
jgi:hypothetical protein